jgi:hypothetical protein
LIRDHVQPSFIRMKLQRNTKLSASIDP